MMHRTKKFLTALIILLIAVASMVVLYPGRDGPYLLDDFSNIVDQASLQPAEWNVETAWKATLGNRSGPLGRPVSAFSFVLNAVYGLDPASLKLTNIVLHAATVVLIAMLALRLFSIGLPGHAESRRRLFALLAASAWAVHPIAVTSTLYIVQRMNLMAALFTVAALLAWLAFRERMFQSRRRAWPWLALAIALGALGVLSKENALLLPIYIVLIEWLLFAFRDSDGRLHETWRRAVAMTCGAAAVLAALAFLLTWSRWEASYAYREFTLIERLLTEARVLWHYAGMVLAPSHGRLGLYLDDIALSRSLLDPVSTFASIVALLSAIGGAIAVRRRLPLVSFGVLFFFAGHLLESTVFPLEIAFEHRNYLPSLGLLIALVAALGALSRRMKTPLIAWLPMLALVAFLAAFTTIRSLHWGDSFMHAQLEAFHHPASSRAKARLGNEYLLFANLAHAKGDAGWTDFYYKEALVHLRESAALDPASRNALAMWLLHSQLLDQPFPEEAYEELLYRLEHTAPRADTVAHLDKLFQCVAHKCAGIHDRIEVLINTSLNNPRLGGRARSEIMVVAAKYFRDIRKDDEWALYWLARATENSPQNARFRLFLARQLAAMKRYNEASGELDTVEEVDELGAFDAEVRELRNRIAQAAPNEDTHDHDQ